MIVVRGGDGEIRAFHNICRHRGNKLVWTDFPREETSGSCRQFVCKYHGWKYDLDGALTFVQQEDEFFDLDKDAYGLVEVRCDVFAGFVFVNLDPEPRWSLREYLGPMVTGIEGYPFEQMTERFVVRAEVGSNWKLFMDAFQEFYHAPILHSRQTPAAFSIPAAENGFHAPHYEIDGPHGVVSTAGIRPWNLPDEMLKPMEAATRSGLFGQWDAPDIGPLPAGRQPGEVRSVGPRLVPDLAELRDPDLGAGLVPHVPLLADVASDATRSRAPSTSCPSHDARERIAHEMAACSMKEYALQDGNTLEATQTMLESGFVDAFPLNDQEVLCRNLHKVAGDWVDALPRREGGGAR